MRSNSPKKTHSKEPILLESTTTDAGATNASGISSISVATGAREKYNGKKRKATHETSGGEEGL